VLLAGVGKRHIDPAEFRALTAAAKILTKKALATKPAALIQLMSR
jgi:hypothetical protein